MYPSSPLNIKLLDVIDHTVLNLETLAIEDFQLHYNLLYILVKNIGLYQIRLTPSQRV